MQTLPFEYAVRNLLRSPTRLGLIIGGSALVVLLVLAAGAFVSGMDSSLRSSGSEKNVLLLGAGSEESVERSEIKANVGSLIHAALRDGGVRQRLGVTYISPEIHMQGLVRLTQGQDNDSQLMMRGFTPAAFLVHPSVRITAGRMPEPARDEVMLGMLVGSRLGAIDARLAVGNILYFENRPWTIVGRFEAPGTVMESEIWVPIRDLHIAARRDTISTVVLTLDEAEFADVDAFAKSRLDLELVAMPERAYYSRLMSFYRPIQVMAWTTAGLIALGGLFGGLTTMYAAFASRVRELAALQTLGFPRWAIMASIVQESVLATVSGGLLGALIGVALLDGAAVRFSIGAFILRVDSLVLLIGLLTSVAMGIAGAIPPAWRCLRIPIPEALKAS